MADLPMSSERYSIELIMRAENYGSINSNKIREGNKKSRLKRQSSSKGVMKSRKEEKSSNADKGVNIRYGIVTLRWLKYSTKFTLLMSNKKDKEVIKIFYQNK